MAGDLRTGGRLRGHGITDFCQTPGQPSIPTGNFLEHLTSELKPGRFTREFVSLGEKQASLMTVRNILLVQQGASCTRTKRMI